jgi:hypothetical protein
MGSTRRSPIDPWPDVWSLTVLSSDADASSLPSGEKATALTQAEWPLSVCSAAPEPVSQSLTVPSLDADASSLLSGEKATALTQAEWPSSVYSTTPEPAFRSVTVLTRDANASSLLSGEKATVLTQAEWPSSVYSKVFQLFSTSGNLRIHRGTQSLNCFLTMLIAGANTSALQYI